MPSVPIVPMGPPANAVLAVTADSLSSPDAEFGLVADFELGRYGAVAIVDHRRTQSDDAPRHPIAYLPAGRAGHLFLHEGRALFDAWVAGDRQPWTEDQTAAFITSRRAAA